MDISSLVASQILADWPSREGDIDSNKTLQDYELLM